MVDKLPLKKTALKKELKIIKYSSPKVNSKCTLQPNNPTPELLPKRTDFYTKMLIASFIIAPKWKLPKCPSTDG